MSGGEVCHAFVESPPLRFDISGASGVVYDDGNQLLLVTSPTQVFAWPVPSSPPASPAPQPRISFISEGPVLAVRFSLDGTILAVQRSEQEVELVMKESGGAWRQRCKRGANQILGFFWTDTPTCQLVFVTPQGLELYSVNLPHGGVRLVDVRKVSVRWYVYTHESRLILLASGASCTTFSGYQFTSGGVVKVPKFEVTLSQKSRNETAVLTPDDLHIVTTYGRLYAVIVDRFGLKLTLHRLYRDAVVPQRSMAIYSPRVALSVVDNVFLVHQPEAGVVLLFDPLSVFLEPIAAPLPLIIRSSASLPSDQPEGATPAQGVGSAEGGEGVCRGAYGEGWVFVSPDLVIDHANGAMWRLKLDCRGIAASCSDLGALLAFLQRRRGEAEEAKALSVEVLRAILEERTPLPAVATAFDTVALTYSSAVKALQAKGVMSSERATPESTPGTTTTASPSTSPPPGLSGWLPPGMGTPAGMVSAGSLRFPPPMSTPGAQGAAMRISSQSSASATSAVPGDGASKAVVGVMGAALSPDEVAEQVVGEVEAEVGADGGYLVGVIIELIRSLNNVRLPPPPALTALLADVLMREGRAVEVLEMIQTKVIPASADVASVLLSGGATWPMLRREGLNMLRQVSADKAYLAALVEGGEVVSALRYGRVHNLVEEMDAAHVLQVAASGGVVEHVTAITRFFCDFLPDFRGSSSHKEAQKRIQGLARSR